MNTKLQTLWRRTAAFIFLATAGAGVARADGLGDF